MFLKYLLFFSIFFIFSCTNFKNFFYCSKLNQGNYLLQEDIKKIKLGMKKERVIKILGNPVINSFFNRDILYYISYEQLGCDFFKKDVLILFFDNNGFLFKIKK